MTKKIYTILVIVLVLFCMQKTYAMTISDEISLQTETQLENIIEINEEGEWKDLKINKYSESSGIIYKLGNNEHQSNNITILEQIQDTTIITILANGYNKKSPQSIGLNNSNDAYIATKLALDCANKGINENSVEEYIRTKEGIESPLEERANDIIKAVKNLLSITKDNYFNTGFKIEQLGNTEEDEFNEDYCSQKYEITTKNCKANGYNVLDYTGFICEVFSTNNDGKRKESFIFEEDGNIFRIAMPKEYREAAFNGRFNLELQYQKNVAYFASDGVNRYIILTDVKETKSVSVGFLNRRSSININVKDKDDQKTAIENVKIKIKDENNLVNDTFTTNNRGKILITSLGKGYVEMEILEAPENYVIEQPLYKKDLDYNKYYEYTIGLKYKKGGLHINNNAKGAIFRIYDKNSKLIGTYRTDESGNINIDEINIGEDYILKQISVPSGFKLAEDIKFSILYNQITTIDVANEEEIKENPKDEIKDDQNSSEENKGNYEGAEDSNRKEESKDKEENNNEVPKIEDTITSEADNKNEQIENEKQEEKNDIEGTYENEDKKEVIDEIQENQKEENEKQENEKYTKNEINNDENISINKLPRTGYDFPEISPLYIIATISILLYILKRTAM